MAKKEEQAVTNYIDEYLEGITNNTYVVGEWVEKIYNKLSSGIKDGTYKLDQEKANEAIDWIEAHCFHSEGPLAPNPLKLELWQKALLTAMFGIVDENGNRQFREVILVVARKNGKSLLASAIAKYIWWKDGYGTRVYCVAPKLDQAEIIYNDTWQHVILDPEWQELRDKIDNSRDMHNKKQLNADALAKRRQSDLYIASTNSTVKKISFDAKTTDGFNPSLAICDEFAAWPGDKGLKVYEVLKSGMGARPQAMLFSCSTAGYESQGIYDELFKRATGFLKGSSNEKRLLPVIYMGDNAEDWHKIEELKKANPNLNISVTEDYLQEEIAVAEGSLSKKAEFLCKYLCIKQNSSLAWLNAVEVESVCQENIKLEDFSGCYCVGGIDLSQTTDLTACCILIEKDEKLYVLSQFFMPSEKIDDNSARDGINYNSYVQQGCLTPSGENFVDYHDCYQWFVDLIEKYKIYPLKVGYDRYSSQYLIQDMARYGFHMDDVFQGTNLSPCIQQMEGMVGDKTIEFGNNPLMMLHLLDSAVKLDIESRKRRLVKLEERKHIDGTAAVLDAFAVRQKYWNECGRQLQNNRR